MAAAAASTTIPTSVPASGSSVGGSSVGAGELRSEFDSTVAAGLMQLKGLEPTHPKLVADLKATLQALYTLFAQTNHKLHSRERRVQMLEAEHMQAVKQLEMSEAYRQRTERDLAGRLLEIEGIQLQLRQTERFAPEETLNDLTAELKAVRQQLQDNQLWQTKMDRLFEDNVKLREKVDDLQMDREDLSVTIGLLKTELTGRIQQVQFMSKGLATATNPAYTKLLAEMQQNTMKATAHAQARRRNIAARASGGFATHPSPPTPARTAPASAAPVVSAPPAAAAAQPTAVGDDPSARPYHRIVPLRKGGPSGGLGFIIEGGATEAGAADYTPVRISKMFVGEPAHESGLLFVGDHIVAVNGVQLHGKSHKEIVRQIQQAGNEVALSIQSAVDLDAVTPGEPLPLPSAPAEAHIHDLASLGVSYIAEGRFRDAIVAFSKALRLAPDMADLYANRSAAYVEDNQLEDAIMDCHRAIELDPASAYAYYTMGVAFSRKGELQLSLTALEQALRLEPNNADFARAVQSVREAVSHASSGGQQSKTNGDRSSSSATATETLGGKTQDSSATAERADNTAAPAGADASPAKAQRAAPEQQGRAEAGSRKAEAEAGANANVASNRNIGVTLRLSNTQEEEQNDDEEPVISI